MKLTAKEACRLINAIIAWTEGDTLFNADQVRAMLRAQARLLRAQERRVRELEAERDNKFSDAEIQAWAKRHWISFTHMGAARNALEDARTLRPVIKQNLITQKSAAKAKQAKGDV